jgi:hypothetical protein
MRLSYANFALMGPPGSWIVIVLAIAIWSRMKKETGRSNGYFENFKDNPVLSDGRDKRENWTRVS